MLPVPRMGPFRGWTPISNATEHLHLKLHTIVICQPLMLQGEGGDDDGTGGRVPSQKERRQQALDKYKQKRKVSSTFPAC